MKKASQLLNDSKFVVGFLAIGATVLMAVFAFALSYTALQALAKGSGAVTSGLDVIWPLVVDLGLIVFGLTALYKTMCGLSATTQRVLVLVFSGLSVVFNVAHSPVVLVSQLIAAMPPVAFVLTIESLLELVAHAVGESAEAHELAQARLDLGAQDKQIATLTEQVRELDDLRSQMAELQAAQSAQLAEQPQATAQLQPATGGNQRKVDLQELLALALAYPQAQGRWYAEQLGVSPSAITRGLQALESSGQLHRNGHGWAAQAEAEPQAQAEGR